MKRVVCQLCPREFYPRAPTHHVLCKACRQREKYRNDVEYRERVKAAARAHQPDKERMRKYRKKRYHENRERAREQGRAAYHRCKAKFTPEQCARKKARAERAKLAVYGLTKSVFEGLRMKQNGLCAICLRPPKAKGLAVDHCHKTGRVRGLLCGWCNTAIGLLQDDTRNATRAARYLENV